LKTSKFTKRLGKLDINPELQYVANVEDVTITASSKKKLLKKLVIYSLQTIDIATITAEALPKVDLIVVDSRLIVYFTKIDLTQYATVDETFNSKELFRIRIAEKEFKYSSKLLNKVYRILSELGWEVSVK